MRLDQRAQKSAVWQTPAGIGMAAWHGSRLLRTGSGCRSTAEFAAWVPAIAAAAPQIRAALAVVSQHVVPMQAGAADGW